ncbi:acyl-CoA thioesterase [Haloarchaeobius litoreus]|uniref:Acyl-CoA thioesterase n=1 Tax=Haloarchaeobius litoreus TaxID=755306 RepID=A0ABD6DK42_9EURY|nr:acyl-CoA thioesterase [Haloarchaeobius litoreus]
MPSLTDTYVENRVIVNPNDANNLGAAHGGNVMKWMDEVAAMAAMRFAGEICVTARMDQTNFRRPIPQADIALVRAYVFDAGRTSVKTRVQVFREDPHTAETELTTESYMVFVAIDEDDEPTPVPELTVDTERGQELYDAAVDGEE